MATPLPPTLRRRLREYRFAYGSLALAETIGLAALLLALANPAWALLAPAWLAWRFLHRPSPRGIAATLAGPEPRLQEKLTAAVELAASPDPVAIKGSPELLAQLLAEADRQVADVEVARLFSLKPVAVLLAAALLANLALAHQREHQHHLRAGAATPRSRPAPARPPPPTPGAPAPALTAAARVDQLARLAATLKSLPATLQRALPPEERSLDSAVTTAQQADRAMATGDLTEARALQQSVAETLAEFARLARLVPRLAVLAAAADGLAQQFAAAATRSALMASGLARSAATNPPVTAANAAPLPPDAALLPAAPTGPPWRAPVARRRNPDAGQFESYPPEYDQRIQAYFQRLAEPPQ